MCAILDDFALLYRLCFMLSGGTTKLIIGRPLSVRIRPLECAAVRCPSRLFGLSVRSADGQMRTDSGRMRTDSGRMRTDSGRTVHIRRTDNVASSQLTIFQSLSIRYWQADGCGRTADGQFQVGPSPSASVRCPSAVRPLSVRSRPLSVRIRPLSVRICPSAERTDKPKSLDGQRTGAHGCARMRTANNKFFLEF